MAVALPATQTSFFDRLLATADAFAQAIATEFWYSRQSRVDWLRNFGWLIDASDIFSASASSLDEKTTSRVLTFQMHLRVCVQSLLARDRETTSAVHGAQVELEAACLQLEESREELSVAFKSIVPVITAEKREFLQVYLTRRLDSLRSLIEIPSGDRPDLDRCMQSRRVYLDFLYAWCLKPDLLTQELIEGFDDAHGELLAAMEHGTHYRLNCEKRRHAFKEIIRK